ncbi:TIGR02450 family Trp-rich protein [Thalassotalea sp. M1531]|uniref:TIGR02450 family Trp-rich protein n=1 Tax=Thalassotalea algicola TaxID=2716224 RepID=A0A7Y0Q5R6_9GAMM|nr:TIGR02450 family Trp-rich protein [Thalassotalea algicola]NMP30396.1 TIGR02450 family Trp-rich protein [Thalassotalea algicola]
MNKISPKTLLHSKWTKLAVLNKEKHFVVTHIEFDEDNRVIECEVQAVMTKKTYPINWRELKDSQQWKLGWK